MINKIDDFSTIQHPYKYLIGVDGGGTGTRILVANKSGNIVSSSFGAPSALGQGVEAAWKAILEALANAFKKDDLSIPMLSECAIGIGISGANNLTWKNEFYLRNPGFKKIIVDTDGFTTLLGAHAGRPGVIVAIGTGSVGMILDNQHNKKDVSGWGFPSGDEASGAWLGLQAAALTQKTLDNRRGPSSLSDEVLKFCGPSSNDFLSWLGNASQNQFAQLAPLVFSAAGTDLDAKKLLTSACSEIELMVQSLDSKAQYPLSICGRLGEALIPFMPNALIKRHSPPLGSSTEGALFLLLNEFKRGHK
jgi:glucosamine kinase